MKKIEIFSLWRERLTPSGKILKTMKVFTFLMLVAIVHVSASSYSQNSRLSLNMKNATIKDVLIQIEEQTEYRFLYSDSKIDVEKKVNVDLADMKIEDILDNVFEGTNIGYRMVNRQILLSDKMENFQVAQQPKSISGKVTDSSGAPLPGVSIVIKGTTTGTITDFDGKYTLANVSADATLVFSFVGMKTQEIAIAGKTAINVVMQDETIGLEEVVAIGYGVQKKANLTGSVSEIRTESILNKPVTQVSQLFSGQISGVSAQRMSGEPGDDAATLLIRGRGTFSSAGVQPLILVDGLQTSLDNIDPNSIESISVLKDAASASIYGARAANGVILVTTKRGKSGEMQVNYNGYVGWQKPTEFPDFVDSWEWAELYNEALTNYGKQPFYTAAEIQKFKDGTDPYYANFNHVKALFTTGSGLQTNHNVNFKGGSENTKYFMSLGYLLQNGLITENYYDKYNLTLNLDQKVSKNVWLETRLFGIIGTTNEPVVTAGAAANAANRATTVKEIYKAAMETSPKYPLYYPDGSYGFDGTWRGWRGHLDSESFRKANNYNFGGSVNLGWNITESLKISGKVGYVFNQNYIRNFNATFKFSETYFPAPAYLREDINQSNNLNLQSLVEYSKTFKKHSVFVLGGFSQESFLNKNYSLSRQDFPGNETIVLDAGSTAQMKNSGNMSDWSLRSLFGRIQYSFDDKYLFEANARYDGSSRFPDSRRYGFFPSFSGAWKISKEPFFNVSWVSDWKLRASWGKLGNQNIGNYPYQYTINLGQDYVFGNTVHPGAALVNLPTADISWEATRVIDIGTDISLFNSRLNVTVDYFNKETTDILYRVDASDVLGLSPSVQNAGAVLNTGWEFQLLYKNNMGNFRYSIAPNFSVLHNEVTSIANVERVISSTNDHYRIMTVGQPMNAYYGYKTDGLFVDQDDIANYPTQPHNARPGDIRYMDISGPDGIPDGKVDAEYDRTVLGSDYPTYVYGGEINLAYKNFDLSMLFQGYADVKGILKRHNAWAFFGATINVQRWQTDRWTVDNPNPNAKNPILGISNDSSNNRVSSDFWIRDASYLRLKDIQLGYTVPKNITNKLRISYLRLYGSATNVFTLFSNYYEGWDPDVLNAADNVYYPPTSVYTFGLNVSF
jgi:TonB-linked SusC/RagA family outer membrane protein